MKRIFFVLLACFVNSIIAMAQESKFVGTWKGTVNNFYTGFENNRVLVRIAIVDGDYNVKVKRCNPMDSTDCVYMGGFYGFEQIGDTLKWYWKSNSKISEDEEEYKKYGAIYRVGKGFAYVKYSGGILYYMSNYWNYWQLFDKNGRVVHTVDEKNCDIRFIDEAVLEKEHAKW